MLGRENVQLPGETCAALLLGMIQDFRFEVNRAALTVLCEHGVPQEAMRAGLEHAAATGGWGAGPHAIRLMGPSRLSQDEFEKLAVHLRVSYVDDESGAMITEVTTEARGEVLNALLQREPLALLTASWT